MKLLKLSSIKLFLLIGCIIPLFPTSLGYSGNEVSTSSKLVPVADTWISSELPNSNFGTESQLTVSTFGANYIKGWFKEAFFLFDVSQFSCNNTVQFAIFTLNPNPNPITLELYTSGTVWNEGSLTWNNRPLLSRTIVPTIETNNNTYVFFNVTSVFSSIKNSELSLVVKALSNNYNGTYILSRKNPSNGPYLACVTNQGVTLNAVSVNNWVSLTNNSSVFYGGVLVLCVSCYILYTKKLKQKK